MLVIDKMMTIILRANMELNPQLSTPVHQNLVELMELGLDG